MQKFPAPMMELKAAFFICVTEARALSRLACRAPSPCRRDAPPAPCRCFGFYQPITTYALSTPPAAIGSLPRRRRLACGTPARERLTAARDEVISFASRNLSFVIELVYYHTFILASRPRARQRYANGMHAFRARYSALPIFATRLSLEILT